MKRIVISLFVVCLGLLLAASACFAQMYTVTDLGVLFGDYSAPTGINDSGQVVGYSLSTHNQHFYRAFRTAPNSPINTATDGLDTFGPAGIWTSASAINASGEVAGTYCCFSVFRSFRTGPNSPINLRTDDLGTLGAISYNQAYGINASGQVVGVEYIYDVDDGGYHAFRTAPNSPINSATDDLGTLAPAGHKWQGSGDTFARGINDSGQVAGESDIGNNAPFAGTSHAFRTAPYDPANPKPINPLTDDLGTLGGSSSAATAINSFGQVVGSAATTADITYHAFRTAPYDPANPKPINPLTDDLGTLGGRYSQGYGINDSGQVVGSSETLTTDVNGNPVWHAFLYNGGAMRDLNNLIAAGSICQLGSAQSINNTGQIAAFGTCGSQAHAVRLDPIYKANVQPPIDADGSSVFSAKRGVVPVKFTLIQYDSPTCTLTPATIAITRTAGGTLGSVDENTYLTPADGGSNFRIDPTACQYVYNLGASALGIGTYRVDISIDGIFVGHAVFAIK